MAGWEGVEEGEAGIGLGDISPLSFQPTPSEQEVKPLFCDYPMSGHGDDEGHLPNMEEEADLAEPKLIQNSDRGIYFEDQSILPEEDQEEVKGLLGNTFPLTTCDGNREAETFAAESLSNHEAETYASDPLMADEMEGTGGENTLKEEEEGEIVKLDDDQDSGATDDHNNSETETDDEQDDSDSNEEDAFEDSTANDRANEDQADGNHDSTEDEEQKAFVTVKVQITEMDTEAQEKRNAKKSKKKKTTILGKFFANACDVCEFVGVSKLDLRRHMENEHCFRYICESCDFATGHFKTFLQHKVKMHKAKSYSCEYEGCDFFSLSQMGLFGHVESKHEKVLLQCEFCDFKGVSIYLKRHMKEKHTEKDKLTVCDVCGFEAASTYRLKRHKQDEHGEARHVCPNCPFTSTTAHNLKQHIMAVHERVVYPCKLCPFKSNRPDTLRRHIKNKHDKVRFMCVECEYQGSKDALRVHMKTTHADLSYACDQCGFVGKTLSELCNHQESKHEMIVKTFDCQECSYITLHEDLICRHVDLMHSGKKYPCGLCDHEADTVHELERHKRSAHKETVIFKCDYEHCNYFSKTKIGLKTHTESKHVCLTLPCEKCDYQAPTLYALKKHINEVHGSLFACQECGSKANSTYMLKKHMATVHAAEKFYCDQCDYVGINVGNLNKHKLVKHVGISIPCTQCSYVASTMCTLKRHIQSKHTPEGTKGRNIKKIALPCQKCDFVAKSAGYLKKHMLKHEREDKHSYKCSQCDFATNAAVRLRKHIYSEHKDYISSEQSGKPGEPTITSVKSLRDEDHFYSSEGAYKCGKCDFSTNAAARLRKHIYSEHKDDESSGSKRAAKKQKHEREYAYKCRKCDFATNAAVHIRKHIYSEHKDDESSKQKGRTGEPTITSVRSLRNNDHFYSSSILPDDGPCPDTDAAGEEEEDEVVKRETLDDFHQEFADFQAETTMEEDEDEIQQGCDINDSVKEELTDIFTLKEEAIVIDEH